MNSFEFLSDEFLSQVMETAKGITVAGHKQVLEDGPEMDDPESDKEERGLRGCILRTCLTRRGGRS
jgi:hypothetical protein